MTPPVEQLVRAAVRDLAGQARPANLAPAALALGLRLRRRTRVLRTTGAVVAGLAVLAAIAVPALALRGGGPTEPVRPGPVTTAPDRTAPSTPEARRTTADLFGGWTVLSAGRQGGSFQVWNRDRRAYQSIDAGYRVFVAPAGPYVLSTSDDPHSATILDLRGREPRTFTLPDAYILDPQWSPDGTRLLLTTMPKATGELMFKIIDAGGGRVETFPIGANQSRRCTDWCQFTWSRDGLEVILPITDPAAPRSEAEPHLRWGLQLFSATDGRPTRSLPVKGEPWGPFAWSPNGRYVVVRGQMTGGNGLRRHETQLVEVATGTVVRAFPFEYPYWVTNDRILAGGSGPVLLVDPTGAEIDGYDLPAALVGGQFTELGPA
jgi:hypothetical protein